jgi:hypothetical protein
MVELLESSQRTTVGLTWTKPGLVLPTPLNERLRAAAKALDTLPSHIAAQAIEMAVTRLERLHGPFPPVQGRLHRGRPTDAQRRAAGLLP